MPTSYLNIFKRLFQQVLFRIARLFLNGNTQKLDAALTEARRLKQSLEEFDRIRREHPEAVPVERIDQFYREWLTMAAGVEDRLGNLLTIIFGFSHLHEQILEVQRWYADAENVRRLRETDG